MKSQYEGEDTTPTSSKELWGWYAYGFAAEVFVVCGVGSFIPITLEQLAREQGVLLSDRSISCSDTNVSAADHSGQCIVSILGIDVNTASFAMYTFSLSVLLQALLIISMSGAADHGSYRKLFLLVFAFIGAMATMLFIFVTPNVYGLGALLAIIANTCFGASFVLLNSFLPLLVRRHPEIQTRKATPHITHTAPPEDIDDDDVVNADVLASSTSALLNGAEVDTTNNSNAVTTDTDQKITQLSTRLSANGIGIGYAAAFTVQLLSMALVKTLNGTVTSLCLALFFIGLWWFVFTIPSALWLSPRPGPPLHLSQPSGNLWLAYLAHSWKSLGKTIARARQLKDVLLFLAAWFLLSDAMATISGTAVLFAKTTLHMTPTALALINVVVMLSGVLGAFAWRALERSLHLTPLQTILACLALFATIPLYALLGFIPAFPIGLKQPWEMYPVALTYGLILGGLSSYCRSTFGLLIPPGSEAAFYALYAITDKGSSVLGPAVVGAITDRFGEIRPAFLFLAVLVVVPGFVLVGVDVERGRKEGRRLAGVVGGETSEE